MQSNLEESRTDCTSASSWTATGAGEAALGRPRLAGHEAGIKAVRRVVAAAPANGIGTLTVFAFSSDNWKRPQAGGCGNDEAPAQLSAQGDPQLCQDGIRLTLIGRRDRLPDGLADEILARRGGDGAEEPRCTSVSPSTTARATRSCGAAGNVAGPADLTRDGFSRACQRRAAASGRRPRHPHRRREAPVGLPPLGERLCGAPLHRRDVARLRRRRSRRCAGELPYAPSAALAAWCRSRPNPH